MPEETDPPRRFYGLKEAKFDSVNIRADRLPPIDVHDHFRDSAPAHEPQAAPQPVQGSTDVQQLLRDNLRHANAAGLNELAEKTPPRSRRRRDYWFLLLTGNAMLVPLFAGAVMTGNIVLMAFSAAAIGLVTASLTWVMWFVMDDY